MKHQLRVSNHHQHVGVRQEAGHTISILVPSAGPAMQAGKVSSLSLSLLYRVTCMKLSGRGPSPWFLQQIPTVISTAGPLLQYAQLCASYRGGHKGCAKERPVPHPSCSDPNSSNTLESFPCTSQYGTTLGRQHAVSAQGSSPGNPL